MPLFYALNIFITRSSRKYEIKNKNLKTKRKGLWKLQVEKIMWWPAWFLHADILCSDCLSDCRVGLFTHNHDIVSNASIIELMAWCLQSLMVATFFANIFFWTNADIWNLHALFYLASCISNSCNLSIVPTSVHLPICNWPLTRLFSHLLLMSGASGEIPDCWPAKKSVL